MNTFALTFRKYLADNRRQLILTTAATAACALLFGFFMALFETGGDDGQVVFMIMFLTMLACVVASFAFSSMKSPRGRIATLMTPSSVASKFLTRWIVAVPATILLMFGAFWLTELTRVILWPVFQHGDSTAWLHFPEWKDEVMILIFSSALLAQAFYFFGAIVWPRLSFVKTLLAGWVITTLLTILLTLFDDSVLWGIYDNKGFLPNFFIGCNILLSLLFYGLAYLRFSESDVADRLI